MFLVLIIHADYFSIGVPSGTEMVSSPLSSITRCFFESCSIICVDVFILITGWFGIRPSLRSFGGFIFQCAFFLFGIYIFLLFAGLTSYSLRGLASCFLVMGWDWFIKAYICLYILAPVLNAFCIESNRKVWLMVLISYYIFQSIFGWISTGAKFIEDGYSTISFIGLYLLARYIRIFSPKCVNLKRSYDCIIITLLVIILTLVECLRIRYDLPISVLSYTNPIVIALSLYMLILFSKFNINSKLLNWIAASSFAVFLIHANYNICTPFFQEHIKYIYHSFNGLSCIMVLLMYLILIYIVAVVLDQPRKWFFNKFLRDKFIRIDKKYKI